MEPNQNEAVETPKERGYGLTKFAVGLVASAIVGKLVDNAIDAFVDRRRDKTAEETE